jgi:hypothetical protein
MNAADTSRNIVISGIQEEYIRNAHVQLVPRTDFLGLPRGDMDEICRIPIPILPSRFMGTRSIIPGKVPEGLYPELIGIIS